MRGCAWHFRWNCIALAVMLQHVIALLHNLIREQALSSTQTVVCLLVVTFCNQCSFEPQYLGNYAILVDTYS